MSNYLSVYISIYNPSVLARMYLYPWFCLQYWYDETIKSIFLPSSQEAVNIEYIRQHPA